ncbi:immunoglobulin superfamily member 23 [Saccopteryx bilineata]|uniref:immunoglobulin superfamily member 23 n=1 Tax=Saccopteryx bilineata TaxID=59482 RepID=UPI00338FB00F
MRCPRNACSNLSPAWRRLLLTGTLLASCICSASSELPSSVSPDLVTEGASAHLPTPSNLDGVLSTSWFRGHEARAEAMVFSPEGLPGPSDTGQMLDTHRSLVIRNVTAQDLGSDAVVLETSRGSRSVTEQIRDKANTTRLKIWAFPENIFGVIQSDLNYSVVLECLALIFPTPVLHWTFNGEPCGTGERLIIRRLSREHLGTYVCMVNNSQEQVFSDPVNISLPEVDPTEAPIEPDRTLTLSGGPAIALLVAGNIGIVILFGGIGYAIAQSQSRTDRQRIRIC